MVKCSLGMQGFGYRNAVSSEARWGIPWGWITGGCETMILTVEPSAPVPATYCLRFLSITAAPTSLLLSSIL